MTMCWGENVWTKGKEKEVCGIGSGFVVLVKKSQGMWKGTLQWTAACK